MHQAAVIILVRCRSANDQSYPFMFHVLFVAYGMVVFPQPLFMYSTMARKKNDQKPISRCHTVSFDRIRMNVTFLITGSPSSNGICQFVHSLMQGEGA